MRRLEVRCKCGLFGRLTWTGKVRDGKDVCNFVCSCADPQVDFDNPYRGY